MAKFKVGDRVIVARRDRGFVDEMDQYIGKEFFVSSHWDDCCTLSDLKEKEIMWIGNGVRGHWYFHEDSLDLAGPYCKHHIIAREICGEFNYG